MFTTLVTDMFSSFTTVMKGMAAGLQEAFARLAYENPTTPADGFSDITIFVFVVGGIALATGLFFGIFGMVKGVLSKR